MDAELQHIQQQLLSRRPRPLRPDQGAEAFVQHKLLASSIHQATRLNAHGADNETGGWIRYFTAHFPEPRNTENDARVLWTDWRTSLLKDNSPGQGVLLTHGQQSTHWLRDPDGRLCIDLESMWADFARSVNSFLEYLASAHDRRTVVVQRASRSDVVVQVVELSGATASASGCAPRTSLPVTGASAFGAVRSRGSAGR